MKWLALTAAILLAIVVVRGDYIDHEAVKNLYDEEDRAALDAFSGTETEADEPEQDVSLLAPQNDHEGKNCSEVCKDYECRKHEVPNGLKEEEDYLEYENRPISCRLGARIFLVNPKKFLSEDLWDCCRLCNLKFFRCLKNGNGELGVKEKCLRKSYQCMCSCLRQFPLEK